MASFNTIANKLASDLQRDFGLTKEQAIGFVGNLAMESRGFQTLQEMKPTVKGSRGGYGYAQWTGPRRVAFEKYAEDRGLALDSYAANYGFLKKELKGTESATISALKKVDTVDDAARVTMNRFLRPGIKNVSARTSWTSKVADGYAFVPPGDLTTDEAPIPVSISPALQAARTRLATVRQYQQLGASKSTATGLTPTDQLRLSDRPGAGMASRASDPLNVGAAGMQATPRLPGGDYTGNVAPTAAEKQRATATLPKMDVSRVQSAAILADEGVGALMNPRSPNPAAPNPVKQPVPGLRIPTGATIDPVGQGAKFTDLAAMQQGRPAAAPVAKVPATLPPVPLPRDARPATPAAAAETKQPASTPAVVPAATTKKKVKLASGTTANVGDTAVIGGAVWTVQDNGDGTGKMVKSGQSGTNPAELGTGATRDQKREAISTFAKNNLGLGGFEASVLAEIDEDTPFGKMAREKVAPIAGKAISQAARDAQAGIGNLAGQAGNLVGQAGNMLGGFFGGATLGKPGTSGAGIKPAVPATPQFQPGMMGRGQQPAMMDPIGNGATLGDLSAFTGKPAIAPPIPATMSPGLRTAALPKSNPVTVSQPKAAPAQPKLYQAGGYVYVANPSGGYTKVGKVGQSSGGQTAVKTSLSTSPTPKGYTSAGNGKIVSESGGIYYSRHL